MPAAVSSRTAIADSALTGSLMARRPAARPSTATTAIVRPPVAAHADGLGERRQVDAAALEQPAVADDDATGPAVVSTVPARRRR